MQLQWPPLGQPVNEHVAPAAHCRMQSSPGQDTEQVEPDAQAVKQSPCAQSTLHMPPGGHDVLQFPSVQLTEHFRSCPKMPIYQE